MWQHLHTSLVILALSFPCFGQDSSVFSNYFSTEAMALWCHSGRVERCQAAGIPITEPTFWDCALGKNHAKLVNVKADIRACIPYYINSSLAGPDRSFTNYLASGAVSGLSWSNEAHFLSSCGLPTNAIDDTPYFKSQYPSVTGGWVHTWVMLTNLIVSKQPSQWWVNDQGNTDLFALMSYFSDLYDTEYNLPYGTMEIPNSWWDSVSTTYVANARGVYNYNEAPAGYLRSFANSWSDCKLGINLALTQPDYSLWPDVESMYGMRYYKNYYHQLTYGSNSIISFNPYMRVGQPHIALGASAFYYGTYVTNYIDGTNITSIDSYSRPTNTIYLITTNVYSDYTNDFISTGTVFMATNYVDHYQTNLGIFGFLFMGSIHTDVVAVTISTNIDVPAGTNGNSYLASFTNITWGYSSEYETYYVTNSESTNFTLEVGDYRQRAYRGLKSQLSGIPYSVNLLAGTSNRVDFYENIRAPAITNISYGNYDYPSMDFLDHRPFPYLSTPQASISYEFDGFGFVANEGWSVTQKSISSNKVTWGKYYGTNDTDYIVSLSFPSEPSIGAGYSKGWQVVDSFSAVWWNVTNGFKYR